MGVRPMWRAYLALIALPLLTGCLPQRITAHMEYMNLRWLASAHVDTPDPCLNNPPVGQRVLISWLIPHRQFHEGYAIKLTLRFCNRAEQVQWLKLEKRWGTYIYKLLNQAYFECAGIRTYKVELFEGERLAACWKHQLWAELIEINADNGGSS